MSHFFIFSKSPPFGLAVREKCSEEMWFVNISRTIVRSKGGGLGKMKKCDISGPNLPPGTTPKRGGSCDQIVSIARIVQPFFIPTRELNPEICENFLEHGRGRMGFRKI